MGDWGLGLVREVYFKLTKITKCKNCGGKLSCKVSTCESGHTVCDACYSSLESCRRCHGEFLDSYHVFYSKVMLALSDTGSFLDSLHDLLECPVCYEPLSAPSWSCYNGHVTCGRCYFHTAACPLCREDFTQLYSDDINALLAVLDAPVDCINKPFGCTHSERYAGLKAHERVCPLRQYRCPVGACGYRGPLPGLTHHVSSHHPKSLVKTDLNAPIHFGATAVRLDVIIVSEPNDYYCLRCQVGSGGVDLSLVYLGMRPPVESATVSSGEGSVRLRVEPVSELEAPLPTAVLPLGEDVSPSKPTWCRLMLHPRRPTWLAHAVFLAALAANITFAVVILDRNMN